MAAIVNEKEIQQEEKAEVKAKPVSLAQFLREVRAEFLKISWPSREQAVREFFSVVLMVAALTGIIYIIDKVFGFVVNFFKGELFS